jgi:hypothetical protein
MVAVELAIQTLITSHKKGIRVIVPSDNEGVVGALKKGNLWGHKQNLILRKIIELMQANNIWVECTWISTNKNPADDPSHGVFPPRKQIHLRPPKIPNHLRSYVHNSITPNDERLLAQELARLT